MGENSSEDDLLRPCQAFLILIPGLLTGVLGLLTTGFPDNLSRINVPPRQQCRRQAFGASMYVGIYVAGRVV